MSFDFWLGFCLGLGVGSLLMFGLAFLVFRWIIVAVRSWR